MIYLIAHQAWFLLLAFACAALAGWAWAGIRAHTRLEGAAGERARLMRDLLAASGENGAAPSPELERQMDALKLRADMAQARVAELERTADAARASAQEAAGRIAELERAHDTGGDHAEELRRLREQVAAHEQEQRLTIVTEASPVVETPAPAQEENAAQGWRLRYFEQRVKYLENQARAIVPALPAPASETVVAADQSQHHLEWRARVAEARVRHLEEAARATQAPAEDPLKWRVSYLEKRLEHLQTQAPEPIAPPPTPVETENSAELAKWRARYLESRVRHLEDQLAATPAAAREPQAAEAVQTLAAPTPEAAPAGPAPQLEPVAPPPRIATERPPALPAAQQGALDDLSLIEGVSRQQQATLNSIGVYHFEQIAQWTPANVAWVDQYFRLRGRIAEEDWVGQAQTLAREGPLAARRLLQEEPA